MGAQFLIKPSPIVFLLPISAPLHPQGILSCHPAEETGWPPGPAKLDSLRPVRGKKPSPTSLHLWAVSSETQQGSLLASSTSGALSRTRAIFHRPLFPARVLILKSQATEQGARKLLGHHTLRGQHRQSSASKHQLAFSVKPVLS